MHRAPRIPRAHVIALSQPDPALATWRPWLAVALGVALLLAALAS
ncbi:MAG: hypothetical protein QM767_09875 [Anaeromyxobacter sp.]